MRNKFRNIAMISILAIAGIFGVSSVVNNQKMNEEPVMEEAKATAATDREMYVYFEAPSWSGTIDNPRIHYWGATFDNAKSLYGMTFLYYAGVNNSKPVYYGKIPEGTTGFQMVIAQNASDKYSTNIEGDNLPSSEEWIYYSINTWQGSNWDWQKYSLYSNTKYRSFRTPLDPTPSTMRYWFAFAVNGDSGSNGIFRSNGRFGIRAYRSGAEYLYLPTAYQNSTSPGSSHYFYYVDLPIDATDYQLCRVASGSTTSGPIQVWNWEASGDTSSGSHSVSSFPPSKLWLVGFYFKDGNPDVSDCYFALHDNADGWSGSHWSVSAYAMSNVLSAYYTCSSSSLNGYGAYSNLESSFWNYKDYSNGSYDAAASGSGPWIYDYTYADYLEAGNSYSGCSRSDSYGLNVNAKWTALYNMTQSGNPNHAAIRNFTIDNIFGSEDSASTIIIIIASSVALLSVTALSILVLKKRRREQE